MGRAGLALAFGGQMTACRRPKAEISMIDPFSLKFLEHLRVARSPAEADARGLLLQSCGLVIRR
jgi:hypothetical protein